MNKTLATLVFLILILGIVGWFFSRWWAGRTARLALPPVTAIVTPKPSASSLSSLLSHMRPLADNEKTLELKSTQEGTSGLVRYTLSGKTITFTAFVLVSTEPKTDLFLWVMTASGTKNLGRFENEKGGLLVSGELEKSALPAVFIVAPQLKTQPGTWLLSGSLE